MSLIDIVMPVHNRPVHTEQSIKSLFKNTPEEIFRLCVINDGSDQETSYLLNVLYEEFNFILMTNDHAMSPGYSRNLACKAISELGRNVYLYHSDNDVYFMPNWSETLIAATMTGVLNEVKVLGGGCHPYLQSSSHIELNLNHPNNYRVGIKDAVSGYSQLMLWETWDKYGPFDETMKDAERKIMGSEDWAFCQKIVKDGFKVGSIEPEVVIHCGKTNTYGDNATGHETFIEKEGIYIG